MKAYGWIQGVVWVRILKKKVIDTCTVLMEKTRETQLLHSLTNLLHPLSFQLAGARR